MPANNIPLTFRAAPLTEGFTGNLQEFADELVARLYAESANSIAFFAAGSVNPGTNVGPWLKNDTEWYVWSNALGQYVPQTIPAEALKYIASASAPDQTKYTFWIELDGTGKAQAVNYYSGGAWKDIYEDTFAAIPTITSMNAAISAAVGAIPSSSTGQGAFSAQPTATQSVVFAAPGNQNGYVDLGTENFDPDSAFGANKFTAPDTGYYQFNWQVWIQFSGGVPSEVDMEFPITVGGIEKAYANNIDGPYTKTGGIFVGSAFLYLTSGQEVQIKYNATSDAAVTMEILAGATLFSGYRVR